MKDKALLDVVETVVNKKILTPNEIPSLDLYIDQIMTLFEKHLKEHKRFDNDKLLTKTMINNYSKAGLIKPIKGKKYNKEQILQMVLIYILKNNLSMQEIKVLLDPIYEQDITIEDVYTRHLQDTELLRIELPKMLQKINHEQPLSLKDDTKRLQTILLLATITNQIMDVMETIIDTYYSSV